MPGIIVISFGPLNLTRSNAKYLLILSGGVERQNRTIAAMLSSFVNQKGDDWDLYTQLVCFAYNTSIQATIRQNPFFVLHFRDAKLPSDLALNIPDPKIFDTDFSSFIQHSASGIRNSWNLVSEAIEKAQHSQKDFSDEIRRTKEHNISVQDLVLLFRDAIPNGHKFSRPWTGPYRVIAVKRPTVTIKTLDTEKEKVMTVHMNKCKLFIEDFALPLRGDEKPLPEPDEIEENSPEEVDQPEQIRESENDQVEDFSGLQTGKNWRSTRKRKPNPRYADYFE